MVDLLANRIHFVIFLIDIDPKTNLFYYWDVYFIGQFNGNIIFSSSSLKLDSSDKLYLTCFI